MPRVVHGPPLPLPLGAGDAGITQRRVFTSSTTWRVPPRITGVYVTLVGGGGGGAGGYNGPVPTGGGHGGGAESVLRRFVPVTPGTDISITIGAGGTGGAGVTTGTGTRNAGGTGGATSFGSLLSVVGGGGATALDSGTGGAATAQPAAPAPPSDLHIAVATSISATNGVTARDRWFAWGARFQGSGGAQQSGRPGFPTLWSWDTTVSVAQPFGGGGLGGSGSGVNGAAGEAGLCIVEW